MCVIFSRSNLENQIVNFIVRKGVVCVFVCVNICVGGRVKCITKMWVAYFHLIIRKSQREDKLRYGVNTGQTKWEKNIR